MRLMGAIELSGGWHFDSLRVPGVLDDVPDGISRWNPGDICRSFTALGPSIDWQERDLGGEGRELCTTRSTIGGVRGCNNFVPVLGGNGTKIALTGTYLTNPLVKYNEFGASLPTM